MNIIFIFIIMEITGLGNIAAYIWLYRWVAEEYRRRYQVIVICKTLKAKGWDLDLRNCLNSTGHTASKSALNVDNCIHNI